MSRAHWLAFFIVCLRLPYVCLDSTDAATAAGPAPAAHLSGDDPTQGAYTRKVWGKQAACPAAALEHNRAGSGLGAGAGLALRVLRSSILPALPCALLLSGIGNRSAAARALEHAVRSKFAALVHSTRAASAACQAAGKEDQDSNAQKSKAASALTCISSSNNDDNESGVEQVTRVDGAEGSTNRADNSTHASMQEPSPLLEAAEDSWRVDTPMRNCSPGAIETDESLQRHLQDRAVRVAVRVRPMSGREATERARECVEVVDKTQLRLGTKAFTFDAVFHGDCQQEAIYDECVRDLVTGCFSGRNATVLAYGQTGSGKTFTMGGTMGSSGGHASQPQDQVFCLNPEP